METEAIQKISNLNPPKRNAQASSWPLFYLGRGFASEDATLMLKNLEKDWDDLYSAVVEFEDSRPGDRAPELALDARIFEMQHKFRIIMTLGSREEKKTAMAKFLEAWPFDQSPELNQDIAQAAVADFPHLNDELKQAFTSAHPNWQASAIMKSTVAAAFGRILEAHSGHPEASALSQLLKSALLDPLVFHTETLLDICCTLADQTDCDPETAKNIFNLYAGEFLPETISFDEIPFRNRSLTIVASERNAIPVTWPAYTSDRYQRAMAALGFNRGLNAHRLIMLGSLLSPMSNLGAIRAMQIHIDLLLELDCTADPPPPGYQRELNRWILAFAEDCLAGADSAQDWLREESQSVDVAKVRAVPLASALAAFLDGCCDEAYRPTRQNAETAVIASFFADAQALLDKCDKLEESEISAYLELVLVFWNDRFPAFKAACLRERQSQGFALLKPDGVGFEGFWREFDETMVPLIE